MPRDDGCRDPPDDAARPPSDSLPARCWSATGRPLAAAGVEGELVQLLALSVPFGAQFLVTE